MVADEVSTRVQRAGIPVFGSYVPVPGRHPANDLLQGFFLVLGFIGALALIVSGFLVVNTVSAILAQQTRQIGIMKAIGARNGQIAGLYLVLVLAYAVLALAVALPLGALGAYGFAQFTAGLANFDIVGVSIPPEVIALEVVIGLVVPLLAALVPIYRGVRITVREALASTGINDRFGSGRFDRLLRDIRGLPRPTLLSIRNTFRRKGRLLLTLAALGLGGAIFMSVFSVRASLVKTLDDTLAYFAYDVQVELATTERTSVLVNEAMAVPGVVAAEPWRFASTGVVDAGGTEGPQVVAFGLPPNAQTVRPVVQEGRWLLPDDGNALVATANVRDDNPDLAVGDTVTLRIDGKDTAWTLVGIVQSPTRRPFFYAPDVALERATSEVGRAGVLMVVGQPGLDAAAQDELATAVREPARGGRGQGRRDDDVGRDPPVAGAAVQHPRAVPVDDGGAAGRGRRPRAHGDDDDQRRRAVARDRGAARGGRVRPLGAADLPRRGRPDRRAVVGARRARVAAGQQAAVRRPGQRVRRPPAVVGVLDRGHDRVGRDRAHPRRRGEPPARVASQPARRARDPGLRMREPDRR